jgi:DNA-binding SARP family transcriptional activator
VSAVRFGILGPLQICRRDVALPAKQRVLLATLLLSGNRVVPVDRLTDALWDEAPPASARVTLQGYLKRLRQYLGAELGGRIVTREPGYLIEVADDDLDLSQFARLCDRARPAAADGDWQIVRGLLTGALALWRGDPLADVPSAALRRTEAPRLAEMRLQAAELRAEADLALGRHHELVPELRRLAAAEPLREGLHGQLMLALYRSGREAEALAAFRHVDDRLRDELGIAAGAGLQRLRQRILAADPVLSRGLVPRGLVPRGSVPLRVMAAREVPPVPGPQQLPVPKVPVAVLTEGISPCHSGPGLQLCHLGPGLQRLPLADRKAAAVSIIGFYPGWSDRMIASVSGLSAKTVAGLRSRPAEQVDHLDSRLGRDGRVRPVNPAERRQVAACIIRERPELSLRQVARLAGISPETVRAVRRGLGRAANEPPAGLGQDCAPPPDLRVLRADPSLRSSERGRLLLRMLSALEVLAENGDDLASAVPAHDLVKVAEASRACARAWEGFADLMDGRGVRSSAEPDSRESA